MGVRMHRIDPNLNMDRYYSVEVTKDLFGLHGVERHWGRSGTWGQCQLDWYDYLRIAKTAMSKLVQEKLSKGYLLDGM